MKRRFFIFLITFCISFYNGILKTYAQTLYGDFILSSQQEVNSFNASAIENGSLTIMGYDIVDLTPLSKLTTIDKSLIIEYNFSLNSLDGLEN